MTTTTTVRAICGEGDGIRRTWWIFRTPAAGASTSIRLATASDLADVSGGYFADGREKRPSAAALDEIAAGRLWELSELLTGVRLDSQGRVHA